MVLNRRPSEFFAPAPLLAVALLALNDHLLKAQLHNAITGKLSDLALCFFLPLLVSMTLRPLWRGDHARLVASSLIAAAVFATLELSLTADAWFSTAVAWVGRPFGVRGAVFTRDPWDLLALGMVPLAYLYGRRRLAGAARASRSALRVPALGATLLLLGATSSPPLCQERAAPLTFRVTGECGTAGLIVVEVEGDNGRVLVHNGEAVLGVSEGGYIGGECPFRLDKGGWTLGKCSVPPSEYVNGLCPPQAGRTCHAVPDETGALWISCESCRARLTIEER